MISSTTSRRLLSVSFAALLFLLLALLASCGSDDGATSPAGTTPSTGDADGGGGTGGDGGPGAPLDEFVHGENIEADTTWKRGRHVITKESFFITGTLTVEPCSEIVMPANGFITVQQGKLLLVGTEACRIKVTSAKPTKAPGDWGNITIELGSARFDYVDVEFGGGTGDEGATIDVVSDSQLEMSHSSIKESSGIGLRVSSGKLTGKSNTFTKNAKEPVSIPASAVPFLTKDGTYTGNGVDAIVVDGAVDQSVTWEPLGLPYVVAEKLSVGGSTDTATLTLAAGTELRFAPPAAVLRVLSKGALVVDGTPEKKVKLSGTKAERGAWRGLDLLGAATIRNAIVEFAGQGWAAVYVDKAAFEMTDSVIRESAKTGLQSQSPFKTFRGNTITGCAGYPLEIPPSAVAGIEGGTFTGNAKDRIYVGSGAIDANTTWIDRGLPYEASTLVVGYDQNLPAVFTLDAGVVLLFEPVDFAGIAVYPGTSKLVTNGTAAKPVKISSAGALPAPGRWGELWLRTVGNSFTHTTIEWGGAKNGAQVYLEDGATLALDNVTFASAKTCDVTTVTGATVSPATGYTKCP